MTQHWSGQRLLVVAGLTLTATAGCRGPEGPTGPAGPPGPGAGTPTVVAATGTAPLVVTDDMFSYTQVPGLSANVTVPAGAASQVLIETDGGVQINATDALASCFIDVALFVDGAPVGPSRRVTVLNNPVVIYSVSTYGFSTETSLTSGAHVISVMAKRFVGGVAECYVSSGAQGSGLPGNPRLQGALNVVAFQ